jgi:hypothetical protein
MTDRISPRHLIEIHRLNYSLAEFIRPGLMDIGRRAEASIGLTLAAVAHHLMDQIDGQARFNVKPLLPKPGERPGDREAKLAYQLYAKFVSSHSVGIVAEHPPAQAGELPDNEQLAIVAGLDKPYRALPTIVDADEVERAWLQACKNSFMAYQRVGALYYLASQVPKHSKGAAAEAVQVEVDHAAQLLFRAANEYEATEMRFAILLQGAALAHTRAKILAKSFGGDFGVMHYLQENEFLPSGYPAAAETAFRAKIAHYAAQ